MTRKHKRAESAKDAPIAKLEAARAERLGAKSPASEQANTHTVLT